MANSGLSNLSMQVIAKAHMVLRRRLPILQSCNKDWADTPAGVQSTIPISIPQVMAIAGNASPGPYLNPGDHTNVNDSLVLDQHVEQGFYLTDPEAYAIEAGKDYVPHLMESAVESVARRIAQDAWLTYKSVYGAVGTPGTTPFGSTTDLLVDGGALLDDQLCPPERRVGLLNGAAKAALLKLDAFKGFDKRNEMGPLKDAVLGRFLGFDLMLDQAVPRHTAGTLTNGSAHAALINGAVSAGATTLNIDATSLSGTVVTGDIFTVAGDTQTYRVTNGTLTASGNAIAGIQFAPASVSGFADNAVITFKDSHRVNLLMHPNALYFGSRRMDQGQHVRSLMQQETGQGSGIFKRSMVDPVTGIVLRVSVQEQKQQTAWMLDCMYGFKLVRPELAVRLMGE